MGDTIGTKANCSNSDDTNAATLAAAATTTTTAAAATTTTTTAAAATMASKHISGIHLLFWRMLGSGPGTFHSCFLICDNSTRQVYPIPHVSKLRLDMRL